MFNLQAEKRFVSMTRRDLSHNILEVAHTGGEERWLVVKTMLYPKKASVEHIYHLMWENALNLRVDADMLLYCLPASLSQFYHLLIGLCLVLMTLRL